MSYKSFYNFTKNIIFSQIYFVIVYFLSNFFYENMGVPGFFRWICQRYPLIKRDLNDHSQLIVNNLFIDINGLIHKAASSSNLQGPELTDDFLSELYRLIDHKVQIFKPTDLIFISADGVAPFAKATQQRERRFVAGQEHVPNVIDHCALSPGTEFMLKVHHKIIEFISNQKKNDFLWEKPRVIYSGVTVPGEGEHKMMNYIRENRSLPNWNPNQVHCIDCGDADLFFLALQTHEGFFIFSKNKESFHSKKNPQIFDARTSSETWTTNDYEIIHAALIREYLSIDFGVTGEELELTIDDFIALSFLIGNDFIPHFKDIDIYDDFDDILSVYKKMRKNSGHLVTNGQFNKDVLKTFFTMIVDLLRLKYKEEMNLSLPMEEVAKLYTQNNKQYISEKFDDSDLDIEELIKKMSNSILDAFDWVLRYYRDGCPSWKWFYPYHYSPPLEFVIPFIDDHVTEFEDDFPNHPLLQLLAILPPTTKDLLPKELACLMDSEELKQYYPETFKMDLDDQKVEWMAIALVPTIDIDILEKKFNEVHLPDDVDERLNRLEFPIEFKNDNQKEEVSNSKGEVPFKPVYIANKRPPFIPTFEKFDFSFQEKIVPVKIFWNFYEKPSILIVVEREKKTIKDVMNILDTTVLVNWPYLRPAKVIGMMDEKSSLNVSSKSIVPLSDKTTFLSAVKTVHDNLLTYQGIEVGFISVLLTVSIDLNKTIDVPINLVAPLNFRPESALINHNEFPIREPEANEKVVFINSSSSSSSSCCGRIIEKKGDDVKVKVIHRDKFPIMQIMNDERNKWVSLQDLVRFVGNISFKGLRQCLRKVVVDPFGINIAFSMISMDRKVIFGCCKFDSKNDTFWFASFILPLIVEYFKLVGSLKRLVMDSIKRKEKYLSKITLQMLYGGTPEYQNECFSKLISWMNENAPSVRFPFVNEENDFLSAESLDSLEERLISFDFHEDDTSEVKLVKSSEIIWKLKTNQNHESSQKIPFVGQRVVSRAFSGPAKFGEVGTVIETIPSANCVVVLFDNPLLCATRFEGILKTNRGLKVSINDIISFNE